MRKFGILTVGLAAVLALGSVSCADKDAEKRIAELENRLKSLEGGTPSTTPAGTPAPTTAPAPEEKPEGPLPVFEFSKMEHDFGTIKEGDVVKHTFSFTNTGDAPLIIQSARGSCGCTVPSWPKEPIPVGGTAEITAEFNSQGKPGAQNKMITVTANTWPKTTTLRIKADVQPN